MVWLLALVAAVVGFAGGFITCIVLFDELDDEDSYNVYEAEEWF